MSRHFQPSTALQIRKASSYSGVGDKDQTYLVTRDGEVYYSRTTFFGLGSDKILYLYYSAVSGKEPKEDWIQPSIEGSAASTVLAKVVGSWNDYDTAKTYANSLVSNARKGTAAALAAGGAASSNAALEPYADPGLDKDKKKSGVSPWVIGGVATVAALGIGTVIYFAQRKA